MQTNPEHKPLGALREQLDRIDTTILAALADRDAVITGIAASKASDARPVRDPDRERELLDRLTRRASDAGMNPHYVEQVFRRIIDHSVRQQSRQLTTTPPAATAATTAAPLVIAYQGGEGAWSQLAARAHTATLDRPITTLGCPTFAACLAAVRERRADLAILPVENNVAGAIDEVLDLLDESELPIVGEEVLPVEHCLIGLPGASLDTIRVVRSHPQALSQCRNWLSQRARWAVEPHVDTALAVAQVASDGDPAAAAIASEAAAAHHGLQVLQRGIADAGGNATRFVLVSRDAVPLPPLNVPCRTTLVFAVHDACGALAACLQEFASRGLNLSRIASRPRRRTPGQYAFHADVEGHIGDAGTQAALDALGSRVTRLRVLGCYPTTRSFASLPAPGRDERTRVVAPVSLTTMASVAPGGPGSDGPKLASRRPDRGNTIVHVGSGESVSVPIGAGCAPVMIAGPCSVESEEQVLACARAVKEAGARILRGGCFKPRTSPYAFQGLGLDGLRLLVEAGREYGLPVVTEVLDSDHVEAVAASADMLQIGARNMQNFALLKAVGRTDRPVLLKRGMVATLDEWLHAAEYILAQGNRQVVLCERGIRTFETATRSTLDLSAVPVMQSRTHLPVMVDPSHAAGHREPIPALTAAALAVGAHALIVEIHPEPDRALSDGPQALTLPQFRELMQQLAPAMQ
ncbi:MAG: bifunctional 3-deoxy-7-phosphoheptulonate synthase/chorismate mutase [Planctomycetota bacterium]